jgi:Ca-activated chloride channel family protein
MHVVMLGKSTDEPTARALAAGAHGRLLSPKSEIDARRAATAIARARWQRRIEDVHLVGGDSADVPSAIPSTIYEGDEIAIALRVLEGKVPSLVLAGMQDGKEFSQGVALSLAKPARHVAQRWAKAKIELFERDGDAHKDEIVKTSLDHGVMSRYTSFLVLDSEAAYARFQIERKAKDSATGERAVSGRDLDGDSRGASVSPDHLQPGDPEVRIPAPPDAQSVVVVFPFGETKTAVFEPDDRGGAWVARFLVDRRTPDGTYEILVRITHKDGRVEILKLPYVVDTQRPNLDVTVAKKPGGAFEIRAKQRLSDAEIEAQSPSPLGTIDERRQRYAHVLTDAKRVEVRAPDGQVLSLVHVRLGEFVGTWSPKGSAPVAGKLRIVAVDRALNEAVTEVDVP